jgi:hypothetical protein
VGDDLTQLDEFALSLLTNDEVIAIDQAGIPAKPLDTSTDQQVWVSHQGGGYVVALFNKSDAAATVSTDFADDLGIHGMANVRDVWAQQDLDPATSFSAEVPAHGTRLLYVSKVQPADSELAVSLPGPVEFGRTAHASVEVTAAGGGVPTGQVTAREGTQVVAVGTLVGGKADLAIGTKGLGVGVHRLRFSYAGDDNTAPSSTTARLRVTKATATTTLTLDRTSAHQGQPVGATVTVEAYNLDPTGVVVIRDGGHKIAQVRLVGTDNGTV